MLVEPERLDDLMSAKTVSELARRDSEQGGSFDLDSIGLGDGVQDLLALHLAQAGAGRRLRGSHRRRGAVDRMAGLFRDPIGFRVHGKQEVLGEDEPPPGHDHQPLDAVLQLADVARPVVVEHLLEGPPGDADLAAVLPVVLGQEVLREQWDIFAALAKRGQQDRDDVQTIVKILTKTFL